MLKQDSPDSALWVNPDWDGTGPGTFALVIGVSRYEFLNGSRDSFSLGQLHVSALTAYRFFRWLQDQYRHPRVPLACCWLLLSPTDAERQVEPAMPNTPAPTFNNCSRAIGDWFEKMRRLDPNAVQQSRSIFFFSGHGCEVMPGRQMLLPCNYLEPPQQLVNQTLSTENISTGLWALAVPEHFLFVDACRNDNEDLRAASPGGTQVLNVTGPRYRPLSTVRSTIVYATGPGAAAWEPTDPSRGLSVFGQALMEALLGRPNMQTVSEGGQNWITFRGLEDFLDPRVSDLLIASGSRVKQPVMIWGSTNKINICVAPPQVTQRQPPAPSANPGPARQTHTQIYRLPTFGAPAGATDRQDGVRHPAKTHDESFFPKTSRAVNPMFPDATEGTAADLMRGSWPSATVGRERNRITVKSTMPAELLQTARYYDVKTGQEGDLKDRNSPVRLGALTHSKDSYCRYHVDIKVRGARVYWVEFGPSRSGQYLACVLPGDWTDRHFYTIELDVVGDSVTDFDVDLSSHNAGPLLEAAGLWGKSRFGFLPDEDADSTMALLQKAVTEAQSPLSATVAALLLLRTWRHDFLEKCSFDFVEKFHYRPDLCVIRIEQLLRTAPDSLPTTVVSLLLRLNETGLPHTAEGLALAARQVADVRRAAPDMTEAQSVGLKQLESRVKKALAVFRSGGLCLTFIGQQASLSRSSLVGTAGRPAGL